MYDTARRVALVKQRVRENTRRRQRREVISLSAACILLCAVLTQAAGTVVGPGQTAPHGACSAQCFAGENAAAMCWWPSSPLPRRWSLPCFAHVEKEKQ